VTPHAPPTNPEPLIGSGDLRTPYWAEGYQKAADAGLRAIASAAPRTVAVLARWAWQASPRLTLLTLGVQLASAATSAFGLLATADVFARLLAQGPTPERVLAAVPALAVVVAAHVGRGLLQAAVGAAEEALRPRIELRAQDELYSGLAEVELLAFDDPDFTRLVRRASGYGLNGVRQAARLVGDLLAAVVSVTASVVAAGLLHPVLAPLVLVAALPEGWATMRRTRLRWAAFVSRVSKEHRLDITGELLYERDSAAEVRAYTTQRALLAEHRAVAADLARDALREGQRYNLLSTAGRALGAVGTGLGYLALGALLYTGGLALPLAGTAVMAMRTAAQAISNGVYSLNMLFEFGLNVDLYRQCIADLRARRRPPATRRLGADPRTIELVDVAFRYPGADQDTLAAISLTLRDGEVVALVGENGSGKTTLAKLISGLYLPTAGAVRWDGVRTDQVDPQELHRRVAVVFQDPVRWPATAANNIRIGRLDRHDPEETALVEAAARSGADAVLADLPDGPRTLLTTAFQNGRDLSGGQWQRISVARGLYRDAALVVADEPTSAMDARAERAVFDALRRMSARRDGGQPRITVLVTHRLANVRHADQIVVLDQGRIIERGRHDELMDRAGTYHQLFSLQAEAYGQGPNGRGSNREGSNGQGAKERDATAG
jgi:ATP-binding cassette subfamily B protein